MEYKISGVVVQGDQYGRTLGYPTINLATRSPSDIKPGVYSGHVIVDSKEYRAGVLINPDGKVEAHLLGFSGDLYGKVAHINVENFIRDYKRFVTRQELIDQIGKDLQKC